MKKIIFRDLLSIAVRLGFLPVLCLTRGPWALDLRIHVSTHSFLLSFPSLSLSPPVVGGSVGLLSNCPIALLDIAVCPPFLPSSLFGVRRATTPPALPSFLVCWLCVVIPRYPHCSGGGGGRRRRRQRPLKVVCSDRVCNGLQ